MLKRISLGLLAFLWLLPVDFAAAHHILGRPAYSLNEDSNTPPVIQGEVNVGEFAVTFMVFPAFPKPNEPGRVNLYVKRLDNGEPFLGKVGFTTRADSFFEGHHGTQKLGTQNPDDSVFRQRFEFHHDGDYIITAKFENAGEPYIIDIPLRVGAPPGIGPIGMIVAAFLIILAGVALLQRRRVMSGKVREQHAAEHTGEVGS